MNRMALLCSSRVAGCLVCGAVFTVYWAMPLRAATKELLPLEGGRSSDGAYEILYRTLTVDEAHSEENVLYVLKDVRTSTSLGSAAAYDYDGVPREAAWAPGSRFVSLYDHDGMHTHGVRVYLASAHGLVPVESIPRPDFQPDATSSATLEKVSGGISIVRWLSSSTAHVKLWESERWRRGQETDDIRIRSEADYRVEFLEGETVPPRCQIVGDPIFYINDALAVPIQTALREADALLNDVYKQTMAEQADAESRSALLAAQRAWIRFRGAQDKVDRATTTTRGRDTRAVQMILERVRDLEELALPDEDLMPPHPEEAPVKAPLEPHTTSPVGCHVVLDDAPWATHFASPWEDEYVRADDWLNAEYKAAMDRLADPAARKLLQDAEQAWIVFRDAHLKCAVAGRPITARRSFKARADLSTNRRRDLESVAIGESRGEKEQAR